VHVIKEVVLSPQPGSFSLTSPDVTSHAPEPRAAGHGPPPASSQAEEGGSRPHVDYAVAPEVPSHLPSTITWSLPLFFCTTPTQAQHNPSTAQQAS